MAALFLAKTIILPNITGGNVKLIIANKLIMSSILFKM